MKLAAAALLTLFSTSVAYAQADMSCADLIKTNKQLAEQMKDVPKDPTAAAMDKKINDYCVAHPTAKASEAMEKAMTE